MTEPMPSVNLADCSLKNTASFRNALNHPILVLAMTVTSDQQAARRTVRAVCAAVLTATLVAGCGGSGSDTNTDKIQRAQRSEATAETVHTTLQTKLSLHRYAGVDDAFDLANGGTCAIEDISTGDQATLYADEPNALNAPDGSSTVQVSTFEGTDTSACLAAVAHALDW